MKKIGILGGSFNPVHNAHIKLAVTACEQAGLDEMLIIPTYVTNLKDNSAMVSSEDRFRMCELAVQDISSFYVSDIEIKRQRTTYTCETVEELKRIDPDNEYYLIMGADAYLNLYKWRNYEYILNNAHIIVAPRDDADKDDLLEKSHEYCGFSPLILKEPIFKLSSTMIREMISAGEDVSDFLDSRVIEYINEHNLYKAVKSI